MADDFDAIEVEDSVTRAIGNDVAFDFASARRHDRLRPNFRKPLSHQLDMFLVQCGIEVVGHEASLARVARLRRDGFPGLWIFDRLLDEIENAIFELIHALVPESRGLFDHPHERPLHLLRDPQVGRHEPEEFALRVGVRDTAARHDPIGGALQDSDALRHLGNLGNDLDCTCGRTHDRDVLVG